MKDVKDVKDILEDWYYIYIFMNKWNSYLNF